MNDSAFVPRLLILEDDARIAESLQQGFIESGFITKHCASGEEALSSMQSARFDAWVVDIMLPGISGMEVVRVLRESGHRMPVLFLTAKDSPHEKVEGLGLGDDYLGKPYSLPEVIARVRGLLRRAQQAHSLSPNLSLGDLLWEPALRQITRNGERIDLTPKEYALAVLLLEHQGQVVSRSQIARTVWGLDDGADNNVIDVQVKRLRRKLDEPFQEKLIHTIRGVGVVLKRRSPKT
jgi:two-component system, OmpR family, copper resistance phosphate regulon response regulator CusR